MKTRLAVVALVAVSVAAVLGGIEITDLTQGARVDAAKTFLDRYVARNGRVMRTDQGNDTVSEGQAYAMLLAAATREGRRFASVWGWTKNHLQRSDSLFAWRWANGRVVDNEPASDADLDIARALLVGAKHFRRPAYRSEARRIAAAVLERETATFGARRLLLPGPWGREERMFNPSYVAPKTFAMLSSDWDAVSEGSVAAVRELMADGALPPDWARIDDDGSVRPSGPPGNEGAGADYTYDAPRTLMRLAEACDDETRAIGAGAVERAGAVADGATHPVWIVGAAAASFAAGDRTSGERLLDEATELAERSPTYYGWALVALGRTMLTTDASGSCPA
ncbi:MAG: glycosyl hydrolase family 8 [Actinomycetota bacterium]